MDKSEKGRKSVTQSIVKKPTLTPQQIKDGWKVSGTGIVPPDSPW